MERSSEITSSSSVSEPISTVVFSGHEFLFVYILSPSYADRETGSGNDESIFILRMCQFKHKKRSNRVGILSSETLA
jgi:hypothetical protein